jgi:hypothetical protein
MSKDLSIRADFIFIKDLCGVSPSVDALSVITSVFKKAGGSWEQVFKGSVRDVQLLKKVLKVAIAKGLVKDKK